jgi:hypothetical protein
MLRPSDIQGTPAQSHKRSAFAGPKTGQNGRFRYSLFKDVPSAIHREGKATKSDPCLIATNL